jgi:hypothetical protein
MTFFSYLESIGNVILLTVPFSNYVAPRRIIVLVSLFRIHHRLGLDRRKIVEVVPILILMRVEMMKRSHQRQS